MKGYTMGPWTDKQKAAFERLVAKTAEDKPPHYYHEVNCACTMCMPEIEKITQSIVDKAKAEVKARYGNKKRHRQ